MTCDTNGLALVLSGGGARAAYQVGFLKCLARNFPDLNIPIITGVSAGAINAAFLANHTGTFVEAVEELSGLWRKLSVDQVFCVDTWKLIRNVFRWWWRLISGGIPKESSARSLLDSTPLRELLQKVFLPQGNVIAGIRRNLQHGKLKAFAITGTNYATGQAVTWVMGKEIRMWERPWRRSEATDITRYPAISAAFAGDISRCKTDSCDLDTSSKIHRRREHTRMYWISATCPNSRHFNEFYFLGRSGSGCSNAQAYQSVARTDSGRKA